MLGFVNFKIQQKATPIVIAKAANSILWVTSVAILVVCTFGPHYTLVLGNYSDKWSNAFYISLLKPSWAVAISWIVFSSTTKTGGKRAI